MVGGSSEISFIDRELFLILWVHVLQEQFWTDPMRSILNAYEKTDQAILSNSSNLGRGGSTAVTAIVINGRRLWVANVGDSRAVLSRGGKAIPMTVDHEPNTERGSIENKGGFVSNMPGSLLKQLSCIKWFKFLFFSVLVFLQGVTFVVSYNKLLMQVVTSLFS